MEIDENALLFSLSTTSASCGSQVCLDASVRNFSNLISFQYSLTWDTTLLSNVSMTEFNLVGLNEAAFFNPQNGILRVSWFDPQVSGISVDDDQIIFQLCFDVVSEIPSDAEVAFGNQPIPIEVINSQSEEVALATINGVVNIVNCTNILRNDNDLPTLAKEEGSPTIPTTPYFSKIQLENLEETVQVYPNPTRELVQVAFDNPMSEAGTVRLYDIQGSLLQTIPMAKNQQTLSLNLANYVSGIYWIEVQLREGLIKKRILKQ